MRRPRLVRAGHAERGVNGLNLLVVGGGIGGLTAAIALRRRGHAVTVIERDPAWSVYGVGIIQPANVIRAMAELGLVDDYLSAGFGFDQIEVYAPDGTRLARVPAPRLVERYPASLGIARPALHKVLGDATTAAGAEVRLGVTVVDLADDASKVDVTFSDGSSGSFDVVIAADGAHSEMRARLFPEVPAPEFTGQAVWRYNLPRPEGLDALHVYNGPTGVGLVPLSDSLMYIYVTTPEPGNPRHPREGLAAAMRARIANCAPAIRELGEAITDDDGVVYRPLEVTMAEGAWHKGRVVLLGDAAHTTTPHLGQGAAMAIEDSLVLADELSRRPDPECAFAAYRERRFERCAYIVRTSEAICRGQLGQGPLVDNARAGAEAFAVMARPI